jgi:hypothetical protein
MCTSAKQASRSSNSLSSYGWAGLLVSEQQCSAL